MYHDYNHKREKASEPRPKQALSRLIVVIEFSQKNDKVQKLEDECDWYRKEALRLDSFNTAMKKDLKYMKEKLEILGRSWKKP